jgi:hypothetical protein
VADRLVVLSPLGGRSRPATAADLRAWLHAHPAEILALFGGDDGPRSWRDGDPRCHCTHCDDCGRLYRTVDHREHLTHCPAVKAVGLVRAALAEVERG